MSPLSGASSGGKPPRTQPQTRSTLVEMGFCRRRSPSSQSKLGPREPKLAPHRREGRLGVAIADLYKAKSLIGSPDAILTLLRRPLGSPNRGPHMYRRRFELANPRLYMARPGLETLRRQRAPARPPGAPPVSKLARTTRAPGRPTAAYTDRGHRCSSRSAAQQGQRRLPGREMRFLRGVARPGGRKKSAPL